jgi:hypothetical protein
VAFWRPQFLHLVVQRGQLSIQGAILRACHLPGRRCVIADYLLVSAPPVM